MQQDMVYKSADVTVFHAELAERGQLLLNHSHTTSAGTTYRAAQPQLHAPSGAIPSVICECSWFDRKEMPICLTHS